MCSRFALTAPSSEVLRLFKPMKAPDAVLDFPPRYNIAPTQPISIIRLGPTAQRELDLVRWGLVPGWVKNPREFTTILNARAETIAQKPSFRAALRYRRCLVPATGYYEWTGPARAKQPHLIDLHDGGVFAMAGLWEHWLGADGSEFESAAIVTVPANATTAVIHDRMPALLAAEHWDAWLDTRAVDAAAAMNFIKPAPQDLLRIRPVSKRLGNAQNDDSSVLDPPQETLL